MATNYENRVPAWFWVVSVLALLWEAIGCFAYLRDVSMTAADMAALPAGQRQLYEAMPPWLAAVYAVAVWVGLSGAIMLLMRRAWARPFFVVSLIACLIQFGYTFFVLKAAEVVGPSAAYPLPVAIIGIAALLVWFSTMAARRGWLR